MMARGLIFLCALLAAYSLWVAAAPMIARVFGEGAVAASGLGAAVETPGPTPVDLGPVLDFAPFGLAEGQNADATPDDAETALVLLGITTAQAQGASRAMIAGGDLPVGNYAVGAAISVNTVLAEVFADHVVLSVQGRDQALYFERGDGVDPATLLVATPQAVPSQDAPDSDTLLGRYRAEIQQDAPGLLQRLGLEATDQGYLVTTPASVEILQAGLQSGDLVSAVNGNPLGDPATDAPLLDEAAALGRANIEVIRDGKTILMTFPLN